MVTVLIGYDLDKPDQNYEELITAIKDLAHGWWHHLDSTWFINTSLSVDEVRDQLGQHIGKSDKLIVADVGPSWATKYMPENATNWLHDSWKPRVAA